MNRCRLLQATLFIDYTNALQRPMMSSQNSPTKKAVIIRYIAVGLCAMALWSFIAAPIANASILGYYERHTYTNTITPGNGLYHQYRHEGAVSGSARLKSSTGPAYLTYQWNAPWLMVSIINGGPQTITVTWEETFYVV